MTTTLHSPEQRVVLHHISWDIYESLLIAHRERSVPRFTYDRGELEITDINNMYLEEGTLTYSILEGWWTDAGTFDSLRRATELVASSNGRSAAQEEEERVDLGARHSA